MTLAEIRQSHMRSHSGKAGVKMGRTFVSARFYAIRPTKIQAPSRHAKGGTVFATAVTAQFASRHIVHYIHVKDIRLKEKGSPPMTSAHGALSNGGVVGGVVFASPTVTPNQ